MEYKDKKYTYLGGLVHGISTLATGMKTSIKVYFRKKVTEQYPENRKELKMFDRFRGTLNMPHNENNEHRCVACGLCQMACPNDTIKVISERSVSDGLEFIDNRFVVEGNYKYKYNNGHLAMADTHAAATNFLNALEKIPSIIDQYKEKNEVLEREIPQLQEIAGKTWKKEEELKGLKSELAALDRKIQLELAPSTPENRQEYPDCVQQENRQQEQQLKSIKLDKSNDFTHNHILVVRSGISGESKMQSRGMKI